MCRIDDGQAVTRKPRGSVPDFLKHCRDKNFVHFNITIITTMSASTSTQEHKKSKRKSVAGGNDGGDVTVVLNEASSSAGPAFRKS
jgi:hypothetical protein